MITIVALKYEEPYYAETVKCLEATKLPVVWADRRGWGNFSKAMNDAMWQVKTPYVWFTTDITFDPETPYKLLESLQQCGLAAIHPHHASDHLSHRLGGQTNVYPFGAETGALVRPVPFIEWTAPLVEMEWMTRFPLEEDYWYWYMDLLWSKAVREAGGRLGVDLQHGVNHVYRRNKVEHQITRKRYRHRQVRNRIEQKLLARRFGPDWRKTLWATES